MPNAEIAGSINNTVKDLANSLKLVATEPLRNYPCGCDKKETSDALGEATDEVREVLKGVLKCSFLQLQSEILCRYEQGANGELAERTEETSRFLIMTDAVYERCDPDIYDFSCEKKGEKTEW